ncbi:MAG: hypothetical protein AB7O50_04725, partial [Pseudolabrys sp.]
MAGSGTGVAAGTIDGAGTAGVAVGETGGESRGGGGHRRGDDRLRQAIEFDRELAVAGDELEHLFDVGFRCRGMQRTGPADIGLGGLQFVQRRNAAGLGGKVEFAEPLQAANDEQRFVGLLQHFRLRPEHDPP